MKLINPIFKIQHKDDNIFTIREQDQKQILVVAREIIQPAIDLGCTLNELTLKDSRFSSGELSKTVKQTLAIKLQKATSHIDLSLHIPKLVDSNYIIINGRRKIPLFQLFDIPVVPVTKSEVSGVAPPTAPPKLALPVTVSALAPFNKPLKPTVVPLKPLAPAPPKTTLFP